MIQISNQTGTQPYLALWQKGQYKNLTFTSEVPGGMTTASFMVPVDYHLPYAWADILNKVQIFIGLVDFRGLGPYDPVWSGYIYAVERYWEKDNSGIKVDCLGWVSKMAHLYINSDLSNEKASTFINAHVLAGELNTWLDSGTIDTTDYLIPGVRDYQPYKTVREVMDDLYSFNQDTHNWYVWGNYLYWIPIETAVSYHTSTKFSEGAVRQDLSDFSNYVRYSYRDMAGVITTGFEEDTASVYPQHEILDSYSDNMTAAQAETLAEASLINHKVLGATAEITVKKAWDELGNIIPVAQIRPGKIMMIDGLLPARASVGEVFVANDIDTFTIKSITYNEDTQTVDISPGRLPHTLPNVVRAR